MAKAKAKANSILLHSGGNKVNETFSRIFKYALGRFVGVPMYAAIREKKKKHQQYETQIRIYIFFYFFLTIFKKYVDVSGNEISIGDARVKRCLLGEQSHFILSFTL